jgi:3-hydroxyisobutyrate dehydrogenase-like beta-hydroxyacid dehydrogenase
MKHMATIGLITPGAMGASVGAAAMTSGAKVIWASEERSQATLQRAEDAALEDCSTLKNLVSESDIILSVCPPHNAAQVADEVIELGFDGLYVEGNAIAPELSRQIGIAVTGNGARFVDGGIIGMPAWKAEFGTHFYLSGVDAQLVANLFTGSNLKASMISEKIGAASALKMTFAAFTKGSIALLSGILAVAEKEGVRENLEKQWGEDFTRQTHERVILNTAKAWRFEGEMREIAATFTGAGLPGGFHEAAAEVFASLAEYREQTDPPSIESVLASLLRYNS